METAYDSSPERLLNAPIDMIPRLPSSTLEPAIAGRSTLDALCRAPFVLLDGIRIADYVGDYRMRQSRHGEHDLICASAQVFFEEDGVFVARHDGADYSREYAVVLFASFLVVEFNAFTPEAHFLVLVPALEASDEARYQGLWAAQRIERLQLALREPGAEAALFAELDRLRETLNYLPPEPPQQGGSWLSQLFKRR
ncbi:MAG: hypothetical protein P8Z69_07365 [Acidihalobacter sp.]